MELGWNSEQGSVKEQTGEFQLTAGQTTLKSRQAEVIHEEMDRLRSKIGQLTMDKELPYRKIHLLELSQDPIADPCDPRLA